ncbi:MAG: hypothetical protein JW751_20330, partial [Polyangiaceae bacterium]|nr:hypothetical protein [Polyangiaceae bacterium]
MAGRRTGSGHGWGFGCGKGASAAARGFRLRQGGFGCGKGVSAAVVGRAALQQRLCLGRAPHATTHTASRCGTRVTR